jgi:hypothetical protein
MPIRVKFPDDTEMVGDTATDILAQLTGGWNPESVSDVRAAIARRVGLDAEQWRPSRISVNSDFIEAVCATGAWSMEWIPE